MIMFLSLSSLYAEYGFSDDGYKLYKVFNTYLDNGYTTFSYAYTNEKQFNKNYTLFTNSKRDKINPVFEIITQYVNGSLVYNISFKQKGFTNYSIGWEIYKEIL